MTVSTLTRKTTPAVGNNVNKTWPFTFKAPIASEVFPYLVHADGTEEPITSDFALTLNTDQETTPGGTFTYPVTGAAISSNYSFMAVRVTQHTQPLDLVLGGNFSPDNIENALDRNVLIDQEQSESLARSVKIPISDVSGVDVELPTPEGGKALVWNASGTALENGTLSAEVTVGAAYVYEEVEATSGQTAFTLSAFSYTPGLNNLAVYVNGVRQAQSAYAETNSTTVTFSEGLEVGDLAYFVSADAVTTSITDASAVTYTPAGTGADSRTVQDKLAEFASVTDFGADITGVVDATAQIQEALDAHLWVYFPKGDYLITSELTVRNNHHVAGEGRLNSRINCTGCGGFYIDKQNVTLEDIFIRGDSTVGMYGVEGDGASKHLRMKNLHIDYFGAAAGGAAVYLHDAPSVHDSVYMESVITQYCGRGFWLDTVYNVTMQGCNAEQIAGDMLLADTVKGLTVDGGSLAIANGAANCIPINLVDCVNASFNGARAASGIEGLVKLTTSHLVSFTGCRFSVAALSVHNLVHLVGSTHNTFTSCLVDDLNGAGGEVGILLDSNSHYNEFKQIMIEEDGAYTGTAVTDLGRFNTFDNVTIGDGSTGVDADGQLLGTPEPSLWSDYFTSFLAARSGPTPPTLTAFGPSGNIQQLAFGINDIVYVAFHINHDIKAGSTMYPHIHWTTNGTQTNSVKWQLDWVSAAGHDQANFPADTTITLEQDAAGTAWRHMIKEDAVGIPAPEVDSLVIFKVTRITNGGTDNTDVVFGMYADLHVQIDRAGTVKRAPDFYTP